jgi:hypothetical protein
LERAPKSRRGGHVLDKTQAVDNLKADLQVFAVLRRFQSLDHQGYMSPRS